MRRLAALLRPVRRAVLARRRLIAAVLAAAAVAAGLHAATAPPPATVPVVVAVRDLPSGTVVGSGDVRTVGFAPGSVPAGDVTDPVGRTLAAPLREGEPLTDVRLVGPSLTDGYPGLVAVPVRLPDAGVAGLLTVGDRVDLVAAEPRGESARVVGSGVTVLALPRDDAGAGSGPGGALGGRLVVVGVAPGDAARIADASVRAYLTVTFGG
ncbi:RcpC/CpaB family pilus assembly protein [Nocardioides sp.]|uniref:RcpC/CpaB family pilus assembly protein n=1 Tax=Nocardioides sp. TaxID=35761 RepID=UPI003784491D